MTLFLLLLIPNEAVPHACYTSCARHALVSSIG
jgi:hypothetical protein